MIKLGIVGSENFHAIAFSQLCNGGGETRVRGARVVAIWGEDVARARDVARRGKIPEVVATPEEMIGKVDAVLVVLRHGGLHARYALPFLGAGVPTWVDKPFAIDPRDTQRMLRAARRMGTPISSFSTLRYAGATQTFLREMRRRHGGAVAGTIAGASCGAGAPPGAYGG